MKDQVSIISLKPSNPIEMFANKIYPDESQDTELKRTVIDDIKDSKEFK